MSDFSFGYNKKNKWLYGYYYFIVEHSGSISKLNMEMSIKSSLSNIHLIDKFRNVWIIYIVANKIWTKRFFFILSNLDYYLNDLK